MTTSGTDPANAVHSIRETVREACRRAWTELRHACPDETFYYYGLWTTVALHHPAPTASSVEGLQRIVAEAATQTRPWAAERELRWSESDSPYDLFGHDEFFGQVERLFTDLGDPYELSDELRTALTNALAGALADLDQEGFFGAGAARESVVINLTFPGGEDEADAVARARHLNPPSALQQYELDLLVPNEAHDGPAEIHDVADELNDLPR